ncbi:hypothetical protein PCH_Pc12g05680 [Penicillium rubens Wisconsin 54-1255]|uniref:Uncharacterized protein n=1 Tax=Penicillium rubens (strain ATCC 28089 / DSM 1075 / NRRL 1951 / Wisconsin 54-1255) TaxID=500485 RepID=B6GZN3_PENRW|nr:hypothetical protein PCH_Pc12g05680 [Penicillium rubens Wisconsin 54-1255]
MNLQGIHTQNTSSKKGEDETGWVKVVGKDNVWRERGGRDFYGKIDVIVLLTIDTLTFSDSTVVLYIIILRGNTDLPFTAKQQKHETRLLTPVIYLGSLGMQFRRGFECLSLAHSKAEVFYS